MDELRDLKGEELLTRYRLTSYTKYRKEISRRLAEYDKLTEIDGTEEDKVHQCCSSNTLKNTCEGLSGQRVPMIGDMGKKPTEAEAVANPQKNTVLMLDEINHRILCFGIWK